MRLSATVPLTDRLECRRANSELNMLSFRRKSGILTIGHKYYCDRIQLKDALTLCVYYQTRSEDRVFGFIRKPFYTLVNALDVSEEEIFKSFTSTVRNEVRRSERERVQCSLMDDLHEFQRLQNEFATAKGAYVAD